MVTHNEVNKVYEDIVIAQDYYFDESTEAAEAKRQYDLRLANALATKEIEGKNESIRLALFHETYPELLERWVDANERANTARHALRIMEIELERVRTLLRVDEVLVRIDRSES